MTTVSKLRALHSKFPEFDIDTIIEILECVEESNTKYDYGITWPTTLLNNNKSTNKYDTPLDHSKIYCSADKVNGIMKEELLLFTNMEDHGNCTRPDFYSEA